ncbi:hypothetical protein [Lonepinella sp. BR2882]|uniref:hypothetical protein n=1 Tax=Lonepinella sp. BR2882 TaxID=3095283 RepID=UPI003F6DAAB2
MSNQETTIKCDNSNPNPNSPAEVKLDRKKLSIRMLIVVAIAAIPLLLLKFGVMLSDELIDGYRDILLIIYALVLSSICCFVKENSQYTLEVTGVVLFFMVLYYLVYKFSMNINILLSANCISEAIKSIPMFDTKSIIVLLGFLVSILYGTYLDNWFKSLSKTK